MQGREREDNWPFLTISAIATIIHAIMSRKIVTLILVSIILLTVIFLSGCRDCYKTFQLKPGDVQLKFLQHPLYSLEYPEKFGFVDYSRIGYHPGVGISQVLFTIQQEKLPYQMFEIEVQQPSVRGQANRGDVIKAWISQEGTKWDTLTLSTKTVYGIKADYLETTGNITGLKVGGTPIYQDHRESIRGVVFNYSGLIWSISLTWHYFESEPPEVQTYFDHIIETFKILE